jgi:hypothetical protein
MSIFSGFYGMAVMMAERSFEERDGFKNSEILQGKILSIGFVN